MPTYSYACKNCGHAFDTVQSFSEPSLTVCPECGGDLRKVYNSVGVVFKGSGFYRTDSRDSSSDSSSSGSSSSSAPDKSSETGSSTSTSTASSEKSTPKPTSTTTSSSSATTAD